VSNQIIEDIFFMLPFMPRTLGVDVSIMIKALEISGVSNMINHCNKVLRLKEKSNNNYNY